MWQGSVGTQRKSFFCGKVQKEGNYFFPVVVLIVTSLSWERNCSRLLGQCMEGWEGNIYIIRPNFQHQIVIFCSNCPWKKLAIARKCFPALFLQLLAKLRALRPPKFFSQRIILAARFELFCRIFGSLATVSGEHHYTALSLCVGLISGKFWLDDYTLWTCLGRREYDCNCYNKLTLFKVICAQF